MEWLAYAILVSANILGFLAVFVTTFGTFIIAAGALAFSWLTGFRILTPEGDELFRFSD